jgi:pyrroline-5-carboxylate reductase
MNVCFVGGGNMASAMISGLLRAPRVSGSGGQALARGVMMPRIHLIDPDTQQHSRLQSLAQERGLAHQLLTFTHPDRQALDVDVLVLAVKPQMMQVACEALAPHLGKSLVVSVAAGIRSGDLKRWLGDPERLVRCMPNTPALIGLGITGAYRAAQVSEQDCAIVQALLEPTGRLLWVEHEEQLDAVTALSGSGPAYVFYFMEAMMAQAKALGLSGEQARDFTLRTFEGASALAMQSTESPATLRERVTSKGGTTFAGLEVLRRAGVDQSIGQAISAACKRAKEMGDEFGEPPSNRSEA